MEQHTLDYDGATFTFANTMHARLRFRVMVGRLDVRIVEDDAPDPVPASQRTAEPDQAESPQPRTRRMKQIEHYIPGRFTHRDLPDYDVRRDFCWVIAHLESVDGWDGWKIPRETDSDKQFEVSLNAFADRVDWDDFLNVFVPFVDEMKRSRVGVIEGPDDELSEAERRDPK